jgi:hypothetical protein
MQLNFAFSISFFGLLSELCIATGSGQLATVDHSYSICQTTPCTSNPYCGCASNFDKNNQTFHGTVPDHCVNDGVGFSSTAALAT